MLSPKRFIWPKPSAGQDRPRRTVKNVESHENAPTRRQHAVEFEEVVFGPISAVLASFILYKRQHVYTQNMNSMNMKNVIMNNMEIFVHAREEPHHEHEEHEHEVHVREVHACEEHYVDISRFRFALVSVLSLFFLSKVLSAISGLGWFFQHWDWKMIEWHVRIRVCC